MSVKPVEQISEKIPHRMEKNKPGVKINNQDMMFKRPKVKLLKKLLRRHGN